MDKKNTMLLTVIAVATLLVAVVGATFAYFSVSATGTDSNTAATLKTEKVTGVSLVNNIPTLSLTPTGEDMAVAHKGTGNYYAVAPVETGTTPNYATSAQHHAIFTASIVPGGTAGTKYHCTATIGVTAEGLPDDETGTNPNVLAEADGGVIIGGAATLVETDASFLDLRGATNNKITTTATFDLTATGTDTESSLDVTADVVLHNTTNKQDLLAQRTLKFTFTAETFTCAVVDEFPSAS